MILNLRLLLRTGNTVGLAGLVLGVSAAVGLQLATAIESQAAPVVSNKLAARPTVNALRPGQPVLKSLATPRVGNGSSTQRPATGRTLPGGATTDLPSYFPLDPAFAKPGATDTADVDWYNRQWNRAVHDYNNVYDNFEIALGKSLWAPSMIEQLKTPEATVLGRCISSLRSTRPDLHFENATPVNEDVGPKDTSLNAYDLAFTCALRETSSVSGRLPEGIARDYVCSRFDEISPTQELYNSMRRAMRDNGSTIRFFAMSLSKFAASLVLLEDDVYARNPDMFDRVGWPSNAAYWSYYRSTLRPYLVKLQKELDDWDNGLSLFTNYPMEFCLPEYAGRFAESTTALSKFSEFGPGLRDLLPIAAHAESNTGLPLASSGSWNEEPSNVFGSCEQLGQGQPPWSAGSSSALQVAARRAVCGQQELERALRRIGPGSLWGGDMLDGQRRKLAERLRCNAYETSPETARLAAVMIGLDLPPTAGWSLADFGDLWSAIAIYPNDTWAKDQRLMDEAANRGKEIRTEVAQIDWLRGLWNPNPCNSAGSQPALTTPALADSATQEEFGRHADTAHEALGGLLFGGWANVPMDRYTVPVAGPTTGKSFSLPQTDQHRACATQLGLNIGWQDSGRIDADRSSETHPAMLFDNQATSLIQCIRNAVAAQKPPANSAAATRSSFATFCTQVRGSTVVQIFARWYLEGKQSFSSLQYWRGREALSYRLQHSVDALQMLEGQMFGAPNSSVPLTGSLRPSTLVKNVQEWNFTDALLRKQAPAAVNSDLLDGRLCS